MYIMDKREGEKIIATTNGWNLPKYDFKKPTNLYLVGYQ